MGRQSFSVSLVLCALISTLLFPAPAASGPSVPLSCSVRVIDGSFAVSWVDDTPGVDRYVIERKTFDRFWWRGRTTAEDRSFQDGSAPVTSSRVEYRVTSRTADGEILALGNCTVADSSGVSCEVAETNDGYEISWPSPTSSDRADAVVRRQISDNLSFYWRGRTDGSDFRDGPSPTGQVTYQVIFRVDRRITAAATCQLPGPIFCPTTRAVDLPVVTNTPAGTANGVAWVTVKVGSDRQSLRARDVINESFGPLPDLDGREFRRIYAVAPAPTGDVYFVGLEAGQITHAVYRLDVATNLVEAVAPELASSLVIRLLIVDDVLVFNGRSAATGDELFTVPLRGGDVRLLADINPGPGGSGPELQLADADRGWAYLDAASEFGPRAAHRVNVDTGEVQLLEDRPLSGDDGFVTGALGPNGVVWFVRDRAESRTYDIYRFDPNDGSTTQVSDLGGSAVPLALEFVDGDLLSVDTAPGGAVVRRYPEGTGSAEVVSETGVGISGPADVLFLPNDALFLRAPNGADPDTTSLVDLRTGTVEQPRNLPSGTLSPPALAAGRAVVTSSFSVYSVSPDRC